MNWYSRIYISEQLTKKKDLLIDKIEHGAGTPGIYLLTLASNEQNLLDILPADELLWPVMHRICPVIIGIANSYEEAVNMAAGILLDAYRETGSFHVEPFLKMRLSPQETYVIQYPMKRRKSHCFRFSLFHRRAKGVRLEKGQFERK